MRCATTAAAMVSSPPSVAGHDAGGITGAPVRSHGRSVPRRGAWWTPSPTRSIRPQTAYRVCAAERAAVARPRPTFARPDMERRAPRRFGVARVLPRRSGAHRGRKRLAAAGRTRPSDRIGTVEDIGRGHARARVPRHPIVEGGGTRSKPIEGVAHGESFVSTRARGESLAPKEGRGLITDDDLCRGLEPRPGMGTRPAASASRRRPDTGCDGRRAAPVKRRDGAADRTPRDKRCDGAFTRFSRAPHPWPTAPPSASCPAACPSSARSRRAGRP